jgi:hypothetical protein
MSHKKIITALKIILFSAFAINLIRVFVRTWKYGGAKSTVTVQYDDGINDDSQIFPEN